MGKKHKGKPLTGLAAALVKSGHLDEKKAKRLVREQRREEKAIGREGVAALEEERRRAAEAAREAEAARSRERERARAEAERAERVQRTLREGRLSGVGGRRRWFYVARSGRVEFLDLDDSTAGLLASGEAGIVEDPAGSPLGHSVLVGEKLRVTLVGIDKELVRFWNRPAG